MNSADFQWHSILSDTLYFGETTEDRTGTGTRRVFSRNMRFNLQEGFPLYTTKKIFWKNPIGELLWMLAGKVDLPSLRKYQNKEEDAHTIWSDDFEKLYERSPHPYPFEANEEGGMIYGKQLREYGYTKVDQLKLLIENIKKVKEDPSHKMGRRLKCEFWNPEDHLDGDKYAALPACHTGFQCMVRKGKLNLEFSMRSNDMFLGNPYNVAFYATLTHILAKLTGLEVGELVYHGVDVHIYSNHTEQVLEVLNREPRELPELVLPEFDTLEELLQLAAEDFDVVGYDPHGFLPAKQAS